MAKQERSQQRGGNQPITRHPLFPAIVALWFAALFGLGSVLLGTSTIERLVAATGIAKAIPMAAPPLGTTARLLIALGLTGIGGLLGALLGLRLATRATPRSEAMHDLTGETIEQIEDAAPAVGRLPGRRRSFIAPDEAIEQDDRQPPAPASTIFQLSDLDDDLDPPPFEPEGFAPPTFSAQPLQADAAVEHDEAEFEHVELEDERPHLADAFSPAAWATPAFSPDLSDDADDDDGAPAARLFEAYSRPMEARETPSVTTDREESAHEGIEDQEAQTADAPAASPAAERIAAARLDDLSHVELLERLALAMEEQRRKLALAAPLAVVPFAANEPLEATNEPDSKADLPATPTAPIPPVLQRLSSLSAPAPFAPPPFAPPPFSARQPSPPTSDDGPIQPVEDFAADASPDAIGGWLDNSEEAIADAAPIAGLLEEGAASAPVSSLPAALRPVDTAFDDDDALPGYIPPRRIVMPIAAAPAVDSEPSGTIIDRPLAGLAGGHDFAPPLDEDEEDETSIAFADEDFADDGEDVVEEGVLEEGYSSLLSLQRRAEPRNGLIAIDDEASATSGEHATSVVDAHASGATLYGDISDPAAPTSPDTQPPLPGARLFDPPGRPDPADTEKALRAALATLQRMSGAA